MLMNGLLIIFSIAGFGILPFLGICLHRQRSGSSKPSSIELFPKEVIYAENAYEDENFNLSIADKDECERCTAAQRGSVRATCDAYFTSDEYVKYREMVLKTDLP